MILWLTGNSGSGKTSLARRLASGSRSVVVLDGDELRAVWPGLGFSRRDRWEQCARVARLAALLDGQGLTVIVAVICPYEDLRRWVQSLTGCKFLYLPGGRANRPYEPPLDPDATVSTGR